jgi:hypothetical protein
LEHFSDFRDKCVNFCGCDKDRFEAKVDAEELLSIIVTRQFGKQNEEDLRDARSKNPLIFKQHNVFKRTI